MDQSRSQCPILKKKDAIQKEQGKVKENKYDVKPPRDLRSKYLMKVNKHHFLNSIQDLFLLLFVIIFNLSIRWKIVK